MADDKPYKIYYDLVEGVGLVVKLDEVQSYGALLSYDWVNEDVFIVIPSATCPVGDLKHIEDYCKQFGYRYQPPAAAAGSGALGGGGGGGGSGEGNVQLAYKSCEPSESSGRK